MQNFGNVEETFRTRFTIGTGYSDTVTITLAARAEETLAFTNWVADPVGTFEVGCTVEVALDTNAANDALEDSVVVRPLAGVSDGGGLPSVFSLEKVLPNPSDRKSVV